jgi:hypothetical protein
MSVTINVREYHRGNKKWATQINWKYRVTRLRQGKNKNKKTTTQYVLGSVVRKQPYIT